MGQGSEPALEAVMWTALLPHCCLSIVIWENESLFDYSGAGWVSVTTRNILTCLLAEKARSIQYICFSYLPLNGNVIISESNYELIVHIIWSELNNGRLEWLQVLDPEPQNPEMKKINKMKFWYQSFLKKTLLGVLMYTFNPSTQEIKAGRSGQQRYTASEVLLPKPEQVNKTNKSYSSVPLNIPFAFLLTEHSFG